MQPREENYDFDLDHALNAVVGLRSIVSGDAFTADTLGTERLGHGVLISKDGLILTIGYLITEAETVWLRLADSKVVQGHVIGYDRNPAWAWCRRSPVSTCLTWLSAIPRH